MNVNCTCRVSTEKAKDASFCPSGPHHISEGALQAGQVYGCLTSMLPQERVKLRQEVFCSTLPVIICIRTVSSGAVAVLLIAPAQRFWQSIPREPSSIKRRASTSQASLSGLGKEYIAFVYAACKQKSKYEDTSSDKKWRERPLRARALTFASPAHAAAASRPRTLPAKAPATSRWAFSGRLCSAFRAPEWKAARRAFRLPCPSAVAFAKQAKPPSVSGCFIFGSRRLATGLCRLAL